MRRAVGHLTWSGPVLMLFARSIFSFLAQGLVAGMYALQSSPAPWRDAARWFPVYATLIDAGCLALLWLLTRRERIALLDLISFDRRRWRGDVLLGLGLIPASLLFIFAGISASSLGIFGTPRPPALYQPLPLLPALYAVLVFPLIWGLTEQMTYNGYLTPRLQVLCGRTGMAVALVSLAWSFQHVMQPLMFDPAFMLYRFLAPIPFTAFIALLYLRVRRLLPFVIAHWLMDGADVLVSVLWPLLS
jgi:membrane protease YdiL (CAAX protease family)